MSKSLFAIILCTLILFPISAPGGEADHAAVDAFLEQEATHIGRARDILTSRLDKISASHHKTYAEQYRTSYTPLHHAAQNRNQEEVQRFVQAGHDINAFADTRVTMTPLAVATRFKRLEVMRFLLESGADPNAGNPPPLYYAAAAKNTAAIRLLLKYEVDPNQTNDRGNTALHAIMLYPFSVHNPNRIEAMWVLLEHGTDPNVHGMFFSPLSYAMAKDDRKAVRLLLSFGAKFTEEEAAFEPEESPPPLHQAAADGDLETVKAIIKGGADINLSDEIMGQTPAYYALRTEHYDVFSWLMQNGADPIMRAGEPKRPVDDAFYCAVRNANHDVMRICLDNGIDINALLVNKQTPLIGAVSNFWYDSDWDTAAFLLENGADINGKDKDQSTALHTVAAQEPWNINLTVLKNLLRAGADRNAEDRHGLKPVHYAAAQDNRDAVAVLLTVE